jgi:hypothetical protein
MIENRTKIELQTELKIMASIMIRTNISRRKAITLLTDLKSQMDSAKVVLVKFSNVLIIKHKSLLL